MQDPGTRFIPALIGLRVRLSRGHSNCLISNVITLPNPVYTLNINRSEDCRYNNVNMHLGSIELDFWPSYFLCWLVVFLILSSRMLEMYFQRGKSASFLNLCLLTVHDHNSNSVKVMGNLFYLSILLTFSEYPLVYLDCFYSHHNYKYLILHLVSSWMLWFFPRTSFSAYVLQEFLSVRGISYKV
jgi:hypothetical protein